MKNRRTVGLGMIGAGGMGRLMARLLLECDERLQLRAIFDPDRRSIEAARRELSRDAEVFPDYRSLCRSPQVDWVLIASWNCFHKDHAVAALRAGKDVFCQKPLATRLDDCLAMRRARLDSGRKFVLGFTLRFSPHYRKIRRLIESGAIGDIISVELNETLGFNHGGYIMGDWRRRSRLAGSFLLEKCCHDIDLAGWMVGSRARRVASFGGLDFFRAKNEGRIREIGTNREGRQAYRSWSGLVEKNPFTCDKDIVDNQVAILEYENGARATFHTNANAGIPERRMLLLGSRGAIRADVVAGTIELARIGWSGRVRHLSAGVSGSHGGGDPVLARELCGSMLGGPDVAVGLDEGLRSAATCLAIDKAMETGRVVDLGPTWRKIDLRRDRRKNGEPAGIRAGTSTL